VTKEIITAIFLLISAGALCAQNAPVSAEVPDSSRWMETSDIKDNRKIVQAVSETAVGVTLRQTSIPVVMILKGMTYSVGYREWLIPFDDLGELNINRQATGNLWIVMLHSAMKGFPLKSWPNSFGFVAPDNEKDVQLRFRDEKLAQDALAYFLHHKDNR
jgi:hypothetical protein